MASLAEKSRKSKIFPRYYPRLPHTGKKKNRLHLQANSDFLPLLICSKSSEPHPTLNAAPCSSNRFINKKTETYSGLETFGVGSSLSRNKFSTIPGHLFTEVTINREVKVRGDPMRARITQYFY